MISVFEKLGISADKWNKCIDNDFNQIEWTGEPQCTEEEFNKAKAELQVEYDAQEYARNRSFEYPTWQEQMDMQYWDAKNGTNTWQEAIEAVKTKYPKGE